MMPPFAVFPTNRIAHFVEVSLYFILSSTTSEIIFENSNNEVNVTVHTPLFREVFWHEYAKIPRHTSQNSIAAGNLE